MGRGVGREAHVPATHLVVQGRKGGTRERAVSAPRSWVTSTKVIKLLGGLADIGIMELLRVAAIDRRPRKDGAQGEIAGDKRAASYDTPARPHIAAQLRGLASLMGKCSPKPARRPHHHGSHEDADAREEPRGSAEAAPDSLQRRKNDAHKHDNYQDTEAPLRANLHPARGKEAEEAAQEYNYEGGLKLTVSVPEGEEIAKKTFNPRLGILGGISILGTSGIVEPMSEKALIESIHVEMKQHFCQGENYILVTPGNYGADYLREHMTIPFENNIKCSNYVGETIDMAIDMGVKGILFVAHIGKFVKVAAGIMNTHSHCADGRMEVLCASAIRAGGTLECAREILEAGTTDEALAVLERYGILKETMAIVMEKIQFYLNHRSYKQIVLGAVVFSNVYGLLGQTRDAKKLITEIKKQSEKL